MTKPQYNGNGHSSLYNEYYRIGFFSGFVAGATIVLSATILGCYANGGNPFAYSNPTTKSGNSNLEFICGRNIGKIPLVLINFAGYTAVLNNYNGKNPPCNTRQN